MMPKVIVAVCARMGSQRLPGKALADVCGKPSIWYPLHRAKRSGLEVCFCTPTGDENDPLADAVVSMGFPVSTQPRHSAREMYAAGNNSGADHVVRVTGDDIMVDPDLMVRAVEMHIMEDADYTTMPAVSRGWDCEVVSMSALEFASDFDEPELMGNILDRLPIKRFLTALSTPFKPNLELNTPEDLERVREYVAKNGW